MQVTVKIQEKDYLHYATMHAKKWKKYNWVPFSIACLAIWAMVTFVYSLVHNEAINNYISGFVLLMVLVYIMVRVVAKYNLIKEYESNAFLNQETTYTIDENGLVTKKEASQSTIQWSQILKAKQSKNILALYISNNSAYLFPKDQLSQPQKEELFQLLQLHLPTNKFNYTHIQ